MGMPFPRYSGRDGRDFFYLMLRPTLPGPDLENAAGAEGEGAFSSEGLPHAGWPHAFARAFLGGSEEARTWLVRIDPTRAVPAPLRGEDERRPLAHITGAAALATDDAPHALFARSRPVGWAFAVGRPEEADRVIVAGPPLRDTPEAEAALGVDPDGFLLYAERAGDATPLAERMRQAGVAAAVALPADARLAFAVGGAHAGVDGFTERSVAAETALGLFADERPATEVLFPDNEPQPYHVWGYLQDQRVRYFPDEGPHRFKRPEPGEEEERDAGE